VSAKEPRSADSPRTGAKRRAKRSPPRRHLPVDDLARFPEENPNPVMRVGADGTLLYANPAGATLLAALGWRVGAKLPSSLRGQVMDAGIVRAEFDLEVGDRVYSVAASPGTAGLDISLFFRDVTSRRQAEETLQRLNSELERRVAEQTSEIRRAYEAA
jgi:hypothetical protein